MTTHFLSLSHLVELRALNILLLATLVFLGIRHFKQIDIKQFDYFSGIGIGARISAIAAIAFSGFMLLFMAVFEPAFLATASERLRLGNTLSPVFAAGMIFFETVIVGMLCSFIALQWLKKPMGEFHASHNR